MTMTKKYQCILCKALGRKVNTLVPSLINRQYGSGRQLTIPRLHIGRITPIVFFVIMPSITVTLSTISYFIYDIYPLTAITFFSTIIASFCYALIRPYYIKMYFKQGLEQALSEYETVKKIILIIIIITIFGLILYNDSKADGYISNAVIGSVIGLFGLENNEETIHLISSLINYPSAVSGIFMFTGISSLIMYGLIISKKESRSYISKCSFMVALDKQDTFEQMRYFNLGLHEYNRYLKRNLKHQIKDIDKIFSKVSLLDNATRTTIIGSLSDSLGIETDKLEPLRSISTKLMESKDAESALVPESLRSQLKVIGTFLAASIPIVVSIITLIMTIAAG